MNRLGSGLIWGNEESSGGTKGVPEKGSHSLKRKKGINVQITGAGSE